jgi:hypothetical protein
MQHPAKAVMKSMAPEHFSREDLDATSQFASSSRHARTSNSRPSIICRKLTCHHRCPDGCYPKLAYRRGSQSLPITENIVAFRAASVGTILTEREATFAIGDVGAIWWPFTLNDSPDYFYQWIPGGFVGTELLDELAEL